MHILVGYQKTLINLVVFSIATGIAIALAGEEGKPLLRFFLLSYFLHGGPTKSLWIDLEKKCLRNSQIFLDGAFQKRDIFLSFFYFKKLNGL